MAELRNQGPVYPGVDESAGERGCGTRGPHFVPGESNRLTPGPEVLSTRFAKATERAAAEGAGPREEGVRERTESLPYERGTGDEVGMEALVRQCGPALGG